jgi:hypothetical protein
MLYAGKFVPAHTTVLVSEMGIFDRMGTLTGGFDPGGGLPLAQTAGIMMLRTVYPDSARVEHVQNRDFFVLTQTVSQVSVS